MHFPRGALADHAVTALQYWQLLAEVPLQSWLDTGRQPQDQAAPSAEVLQPGEVAVTWRGDGRYFATADRQAPGQQQPFLGLPWTHLSG